MKKIMLINASHEEESRVAIVVDNYLQELDIESAQKALTKGNIYKATITKVEASLQAAFVEYGAARQGFLSLNEIHPDYWREGVDKTTDPRSIKIQDVVESKQTLLIQVVKEERGNKGAAVTTNISLAGRYLVLIPNTERGGISRKLSESERKAIKEIISQLDVPERTGVIVRTAGRDQPLEALQWDFQYLRRIWDEIRTKGESAPAPALIYQEGDIATRAIRDHFTDDIEEIWVDNRELYNRTKSFVHAVLPGKETLVKQYRQKKSMFRHFNVESQCEEIHEREIRLPSGGSIVFDPTEALTSIDINSSRATGGKHIDETALETNLEAASEIARQLRIRDIGGLIVIDFIDMANRKHAQQVETVLRDSTKADKARIQFARISRFGLLEMSRQRLHPSVRESTTELCPRCRGKGTIRTIESMALQMLTRMEDWAESGKKPILVVQVPSETGEYLMNRKRDNIAQIETSYDVQITLQIRPDLDIPHYRIERHWSDAQQQRTETLEDTSKSKKPSRPSRKLKPMKPVVGIPNIQHPKIKEKPVMKTEEKTKGWFSRLVDSLFGLEKKKALEEEKAREERRRQNRNRNRRRKRGGTPRPQGEKKDQQDNKVDPKSNDQVDENASRKKPNQRRRPRNKPQQDKTNPEVAQAEQEKSTDSQPKADAANKPVQTGDEAQPKRRRRRRRRRPADASSQNNQGDSTPQPEGKESNAANNDNKAVKQASGEGTTSE